MVLILFQIYLVATIVPIFRVEVHILVITMLYYANQLLVFNSGSIKSLSISLPNLVCIL
jgi:hypothetical protein